MKHTHKPFLAAAVAIATLSGCGGDSSATAGGAGASRTTKVPISSTTSPTCLGKDLLVRPLNTEGMPPAVAKAAAELRSAALACNSKRLMQLGADARYTSGDGATPARVFALPQRQDRRYDMLLKLLSTPPARNLEQGATTASYVWPRAWAAQTNRKDPAVWRELEAAQVLTPEQAKAYQRPPQYPGENEAYLGWRIEISQDGKLESFTKGD